MRSRASTFEIGHPKLITPMFFRHLGTVMESLTFEMGQEGPANGTVQLVAQGEEKAAATIDATPDAYQLKRFSQGRGFIRRGGVALAQVSGGNLSFSNNLERVRVIRDDGKIEAADPTIATCTGVMSLRFDGATLVAEAAKGDAVALEYGFSMAEGWALTFELFRVFLPKPKYAIGGPGGVEAMARRLWQRRRYDAAGEAAQRRGELHLRSHGKRTDMGPAALGPDPTPALPGLFMEVIGHRVEHRLDQCDQAAHEHAAGQRIGDRERDREVHAGEAQCFQHRS
jgi:hypothetical protein